MKIINQLVLCSFVVLVIAGCASTKVSDRQRLVNERIPRPDRIIVNDFVATHGDVPADSALASHSTVQQRSQTAEQIATGRRVGAEIASKLVREIRGMGMPAERASKRTTTRINDIVIRGYLLSVEEGSKGKRMLVGFGSGSSHLQVAVEGYQMTAKGLRKLGSGKVDAGSGKAPGAVAPIGVLIATGNPLGLIVSSGMKVYGERSGKSRIEGRVDQAVKKIADQFRSRMKEEGWIR